MIWCLSGPPDMHRYFWHLHFLHHLLTCFHFLHHSFTSLELSFLLLVHHNFQIHSLFFLIYLYSAQGLDQNVNKWLYLHINTSGVFVSFLLSELSTVIIFPCVSFRYITHLQYLQPDSRRRTHIKSTCKTIIIFKWNFQVHHSQNMMLLPQLQKH